MSARCFSGASSISMPVMNDTKPPTVVSLFIDCARASDTTVATAIAAHSWVIGTVAPLATEWRIAKPRSRSTVRPNSAVSRS